MNKDCEIQREIVNNIINMKYKIANEQLKNIRSQQNFERIMDVFGSISRFSILYILPVILSSCIGYRIHFLGTSAKMLLVKGLMSIPIIIVDLLSKIYSVFLYIANSTIVSYLSFGFNNISLFNETNSSGQSYLQTKLEFMDDNANEISQHSIDLIVTIITILLYISLLSLMHILVKWEEINKFQIGWTKIIIETKERNQTTKYEIEEMMKMLNNIPAITNNTLIQQALTNEIPDNRPSVISSLPSINSTASTVTHIEDHGSEPDSDPNSDSDTDM